MISGPVILPLSEAVSAVEAASRSALPSSEANESLVQTHFQLYKVLRDTTGTLVAGHVSHSSHASHSSHVSSSGVGGGGGDYGGGGSTYVYTPPVYHAPSAPSAVTATPGDGSATISWSPASTDDGSVVTYLITITPGGATRSVVGATTAIVYGLQNGTAYSFTVVASNTVGQGPVSVASGTITPLAPQLEAETPQIIGQLAVGQKLKVVTPGWALGTVFSYQWNVNGSAVAGATEKSFVPLPSMAGARISVSVSGTNPAYAKGATATSAKTQKIAIASRPKIIGSSKVGITVHARPGTWTPGTKLVYAWYVDGKKVRNDPGPALLLKSNHVGKTITVRVTGSKSGYGTVSLTSVATSPVHQ